MQDGQGPTCGLVRVSITHTNTFGVVDETTEVESCVTRTYDETTSSESRKGNEGSDESSTS